MRKTFDQLLEEMSFSIQQGYDSLYGLLLGTIGSPGRTSPYHLIESNFFHCTFRRACTNLNEFNEAIGADYLVYRGNASADDLLCLCEYCDNLINDLFSEEEIQSHPGLFATVDQIAHIIEEMNYTGVENDDGIVCYVEKNSAVIQSASITERPISTKIFMYIHHSLEGNLEEKRTILSLIATYLEPKRCELNILQKELASDLFFAFNNLDIRHNNTSKANAKHYHQIVADIPDSELEEWYDEVYQMSLLAILLLDNQQRHADIAALKEKLKY